MLRCLFYFLRVRNTGANKINWLCVDLLACLKLPRIANKTPTIQCPKSISSVVVLWLEA